ncbi:MAG TPA: trehalose-phosphatase [Candidatus Polarisedimenticolia bacterium]|nr:trehalose-phosphatase [Candidatus Polarisedimenticolia bacterium]
MLALNPHKRVADFFDRLARSPERILFLDYDGTIAPFHPDPGKALVYPQISELLQRLVTATNTRLIFVTGRRARNLRRVVSLRPAPEIWGTHGTERLRPDGDYEQLPINLSQLRSLAFVKARLRTIRIQCLLEQKPGSVALHWRGLSPSVARRDSQAVLGALAGELEHSGLRLVQFDGGIELRVATYTKATAVLRTFEEATQKNSVAAYLGDDEPDEDAFGALRTQDLGVLVRQEFRKTAADLWVRPPEEVHTFLDTWLSTCSGSR